MPSDDSIDRAALRFGLLDPAAIRADSFAEELIELACPVPHPWFARGENAPLAVLLGMSAVSFRRRLRVRGGEWLRRELATMPRDPESQSPLVEGLLHGGQRPEWLALTVLPILPAALRTPRLDCDYARLLRVNRRLRRLMEAAPDEVRRHEARLRRAVAAVFDGIARRWVRRPRAPLGGGWVGMPVKRSAGAELVPDPSIPPHRCGLPEEIAVELFRPLIKRRFRKLGVPLPSRLRSPSNWSAQARAVLESVVRHRPVLLAAPPVREQKRIQSFDVVLVGGTAIRAHPLICEAFGSVGEGRPVVAYLPVSRRARDEAATRMAAPQPPCAGAAPRLSHSAAVGCAYLTVYPTEPGEPIEPGNVAAFTSVEEVIAAHDHGRLGIHARIELRLPRDRTVIAEVLDHRGGKELLEAPRQPWSDRFRTTAGRAIFNDAFDPALPYYDAPLTRTNIAWILADVARRLGSTAAAATAARLETLGTFWLTRSGLSLGMDDLRSPTEKPVILAEMEKEVDKVRRLFERGLLSDGERFNRAIDIRGLAAQRVNKLVFDRVLAERRTTESSLNAPALHSGVGSGVLRTLAGVPGLVARADGSIFDMSILSSLRDGLGVTEYFLSTLNVRGGLLRTRRRQAAADTLTRKLAAAGRGAVVSCRDCGDVDAARGIVASSLVQDFEQVRTLSMAVAGRVSAETVRSPYTDEVLVAEGELVAPATALRLGHSGIERIAVRSPLTCGAAEGVCALCYGADPATNALVEVGARVGVAAALAIGRPAADLRKIVFRWNSPPSRRVEDPSRTRRSGTIRFVGFAAALDEEGRRVALATPTAAMELVHRRGDLVESHPVPHGAELLVADGDEVSAGTELFRWDPLIRPVLARHAGVVGFLDLVEKVTFCREPETPTSLERWEVIPCREALNPRVVIRAATGEVLEVQPLIPGTTILARPGQSVLPGRKLAVWGSGFDEYTRRVGDGERVEELLEARRPARRVVLAAVGGVVRMGERRADGWPVFVQPVDERGRPRGDECEHLIRDNLPLGVYPGDMVAAGDMIAGYSRDPRDADPHEVLRILGVEELRRRLLDELGEIYLRNGIDIGRHAETILARMLRLRVTDPGDTGLPQGTVLRQAELDARNRDASRPASREWALVGITELAEIELGLAPSPQTLVATALSGPEVPFASDGPT